LPEASPLNALEKLLGNDLVGVNVLPVERRHLPFVNAECLH
jgi:hypothetical protein